MKPLVYYCRWHTAKLRLQGRDDRFVWGDLVMLAEDGRLEPFRYNMQTWELILGEGESETRVRLDEMGVVLPAGSDESKPTTSFDAEP